MTAVPTGLTENLAAGSPGTATEAPAALEPVATVGEPGVEVAADASAENLRWRVVLRAWAVAVGCTAGLRVLSDLVALVSAYGSGFPHVVAKSPGVLVDIWGRWDTGYYLSIAAHGYAGRGGHGGALPSTIAFGPLYPGLTWLCHAISGLGYLTSGQLVSTIATVIAIRGLMALAGLSGLERVADHAAIVLVAFPTAFFLLADYPDSVALALVTWSLVAARRRRWLPAGVAAALAFFSVYFLFVLVPALVVEAWVSTRRHGVGAAHRRSADGRRRWHEVGVRTLRRAAWPGAAVCVPALAALGSWMGFCAAHYHDALAFEHVQVQWGRHLAAPWTLVANSVRILVHLQFLDTSTASMVWLFDAVSVVLVLVVCVSAFVRREWTDGVFLGLALAVFTFQTILISESREVLTLAPFLVGLGRFASKGRWRERVLLACFLPGAYYLVLRWGTGAFAG